MAIELGRKFGRLTVIALGDTKVGNCYEVECRCDCGNKRTVYSSNLHSGATKSCGCLRREASVKRATKHGGYNGPLYRTWTSMRARCNNPRATGYENYGGRGIKVCRRWDSFENFVADMGDRPPGTSLDRTRNNGNYCPSNCRWATRKEQAANRRKRNRKVD